MPCGGIYPIKGSWVERHSAGGLRCYHCDKSFPTPELWVEEWDAPIHKACVEEFLKTPEGQVIVDHEHEIILNEGGKGGMPYVLDGREVPERCEGRNVGEAPCIFCGRTIGHYNDEMDNCVGWLLGAVVNGESKEFLYCDQPPCVEVKVHGYGKAIWRCGCVSDYVENVGDICHACRRPRAEAIPPPES